MLLQHPKLSKDTTFVAVLKYIKGEIKGNKCRQRLQWVCQVDSFGCGREIFEVLPQFGEILKN